MRKTQEKIIWSARKKRLSEEEIAFLSREDFTINELQIFKKYFIANKDVKSYLFSKNLFPSPTQVRASFVIQLTNGRFTF